MEIFSFTNIMDCGILEKVVCFRKRTVCVVCSNVFVFSLVCDSFLISLQTGTLTQNIMTFKKCSINGQKYGEPTGGVSLSC